MKLYAVYALLICLIAVTIQPSIAQPPASGLIKYEVSRKIDPSQMRIVINGDVVQPGSPDAPDVPQVATFGQQLFFSGNYAKEEREMPGPVIRTFDGGSGGGGQEKTMKLDPPFSEKHYLDLESQKLIRVLEVKKESTLTRYQAEENFTKATGWQHTDKTRKIAAYTCHKATCAWKGETYAIWYTTDLGFTYSPIRELTPQKGVVLMVEASTESFKATKVEAKQLTENELQPEPGAERISIEELNDRREKAMADFHQNRLPGAPFPR